MTTNGFTITIITKKLACIPEILTTMTPHFYLFALFRPLQLHRLSFLKSKSEIYLPHNFGVDLTMCNYEGNP